MKLFVQWTTDPAQDWVEIDSSQWPGLAKRPVPVGGEVIDDQPGWVYSLNIQGITPHADHYLIQDLPDGSVLMASWRDDPDDYTPDLMAADVMVFKPIKDDPKTKGGKNTDHTATVYAGQTVLDRLSQSNLAGVVLDTLDNFMISGQNKKYSQLNRNQLEAIYKNSNLIRHGIQVSDQLAADHEAMQTIHGWREWVV